MTTSPIRRSHLISPFGVAGLTVSKNGLSMICCGLDAWFKHENRSEAVDEEEYVVHEWRLEALVGVDHFRLPPDYREKRRGTQTPNIEVTVPFLRFPTWDYCPSCRRMYQWPLSDRTNHTCADCTAKGRKSRLVQVPLIAMCDHGHIDDFPWREWVHWDSSPKCEGRLRLVSLPGSTLASQLVTCECGKSRPLASVTSAEEDKTVLTDTLDSTKKPFACRGMRPWLGNHTPQVCGRPLRGSLRSASNLYFPQVKSSLYLPRHGTDSSDALIKVLELPKVDTVAKTLLAVTGEIDVAAMRKQCGDLLTPFSDQELSAGLKTRYMPEAKSLTSHANDDRETALRRQEYAVLREDHESESLLIRHIDPSDFDSCVSSTLSRVALVEKLRETRALCGFTRVYSECDLSGDALMSMLWSKPPESSRWLPAYVVHGEGIYLELREDFLSKWLKSNQQILGERLERLNRRFEVVQNRRKLHPRSITARMMLVHTFAHLLINRLTFECGYSSASLRERLYISDSPEAPMSGLLIYTASGDSEGTLGGLVRMGKVGAFEAVVKRSIEGARWCSADPICMEVGAFGGQGPDSLNLAACHNCALVPETACEEFNRFLDRALVVGMLDNKGLGFFSTVV